MKYYIKIGNKEYLVPIAVVSSNKELFNQYMIYDEINEKKYFNIDRLIADKKDKDLLRICQQCIGSVGMLALSMDNEFLDTFNKLRLKLNDYQVIINNYFKNGNNDKAYEEICTSIRMVLELFNNMMYEDEIQYKNCIKRMK